MGRFSSIDDARNADGLRMVCLRGVPSPWTEAAKGIFRVKNLSCQYAAERKTDADEALVQWAGHSSVPVVAYEQEPLRTGWAEILHLAERLNPEPALIPVDPARRAMFFGLAHEICGEMGFGWCQRLLMINRSLHASEQDPNRFPSAVAKALARKYGFRPASLEQARERVLAVLALLDARLQTHPYLLGDDFSAVDIYWATFANLLSPLPETQLPALPFIRDAYTNCDAGLEEALTDRLKAHQIDIYERYLELPVPLW